MAIDFVITWVDDSDEKWIKEYNKYASKPLDKHRYRDWDILKYWFRAIELYANWVNKIYFVTWGHVPEWLNTNYEKIVIVKHADFIDEKYLPTFNSCVIEANLHRIEGLSEKFVYFNDDMFLNDYVNENDFFMNDLPRDTAILSHLWARGLNSTFINYNCSNVVNKYFKLKNLKNQKNTIVKRDLKNIIKKICFFNKKNMLCLVPQHVPTSYLKNTFINVWENEHQLLQQVCQHKFRTNDDVSQWLFQFWQIASKKFVHRDINFSKYYQIESDSLDNIISEIKNKKYKLICINDGEKTDDFEKNKTKLIEMFEKMYTKKSVFEK